MDIQGKTGRGDAAWQDTYDEDVLVLMPRDADTLFAYWEIKDTSGPQGVRPDGTQYLIRVYEHKNGSREKVLEFEAGLPAGERYVKIDAGGGKWSAEIGYADKGRFRPLFASGVVLSPERGATGDGALGVEGISSFSVPRR